jgi:antibiotic biosynthesis monooxygenase (ABM) superfamily enzyme
MLAIAGIIFGTAAILVRDFLRFALPSELWFVGDRPTVLLHAPLQSPSASSPDEFPICSLSYMFTQQPDQRANASRVIEHTVPRGKGLAFRRWHAKVIRTAWRFKGYIRTDLPPPLKGQKQLKWYSIVHFDSPENLNAWLKSEEREAAINTEDHPVESYQFKSFTTGLEGWFSAKLGGEQMGLGLPAWKQNLAVVLGLYPTLMTQSVLLGALGIMKHLPHPSAMLLDNFISCSLLTWLVMPFVTRSLSFWLRPAAQPLPQKSNALGTAAVIGGLGALLVLFGELKL